MAKMIPSRIDESTLSSAERLVFGLLQADPNTADWTVLHSLGLARRDNAPHGEIDFVVVIPGEGIVCLEVKGGGVSCENGVWLTRNRRGNVSRLGKSPFLQARDSMYALRGFIQDHFGSAVESQCPIDCAVVFTDVACPPITPEFERDDVIDAFDLRRPISDSISRIVESRLRRHQPRRGERLPTPAQARSILNFLRPNFDFVLARSLAMSRIEDRLLSLTEEQYDRLDELEYNPRCLFEGAAGTGKTLLAVEYARRASEDGAKVMLVCYNRLLGDWLRRQTEDTGITSGTWHETLKQIIADSSLGEEFLEQERKLIAARDFRPLFDEIYPFYGEIALDEMDAPFDVLVMDEAQDLCRRDVLDLVNRTLRGGLAGGRWAIFGDFAHQALYSDSEAEGIALLSEYCRHLVRARLTLNCRNTRNIAAETSLIGGFETPRFRIGAEVGLPVEHRYWRTAGGLLRSLMDVLDRLLADGIPVEDIVILSTRRLVNSSLADTTHIGDLPLVDVSRSLEVDRQCLKFSTIHSFKGLESPVVIIVDVNGVEESHEQSLLYVGMSRARTLLTLMVHERARGRINDLLGVTSASGFGS